MRVQVLELPSRVAGDCVDTPFALVIDRMDDDADQEGIDALKVFGRGVGAVDVLVTNADVEVA